MIKQWVIFICGVRPWKEWNLKKQNKKKKQHAIRVEIIPFYYAHSLNESCVRQDFVIIGSRATAFRWVGRQTRWWPRHKAIYFSWFEPELFCLLLGPPGFNCWFSFAPVFQWSCSAPRGSPGVGRNTFLSSPHLCFIIVFICDLFVSRDDSLMSYKTFTRSEQLYVLSHDRSWGRGWDPVKPV